MSTVVGSMTRVNTVASALKRFFSREDSSKDASTPDGKFFLLLCLFCYLIMVALILVAQSNIKMPGSPSTSSLAPKYPAAVGSMKITDQVIEEVDEQMTITSMRGPEIRPTAQSLFQPPPHSEPVNVPVSSRANNDYTRTQSFIGPRNNSFDCEERFMLSTSAPAAQHLKTVPLNVCGINIEDYDQCSPGSQSSEVNPPLDVVQKMTSDEYYEKITQAQEPGRRIGRSISTQQPGHTDTEMLLDRFSIRNHGLSSSLDNNVKSTDSVL